MTKMPATPFMVKHLEIVFFRTRYQLILKIGMKHCGLQLYKVCAKSDSVLPLTHCTASSELDSYAFNVENCKKVNNWKVGRNI